MVFRSQNSSQNFVLKAPLSPETLVWSVWSFWDPSF